MPNWSGSIKSTIYSVCNMFSEDSDEIDDLFQEILARLWNGYDSFRAESDVRAWIYRVALNCCLNADKKKKRLAVERVPLSVEIDPFEDMDDRALQTKRLLKSCEDIILRLQMKEDDPQNN